MSYNFVEELRWRGMIHDIMPGTEELMNEQSISGYIGFDPTADSLHIGSMVQIILLMHLQRAGHRPIALVGGATGMIGDPSGKSDERNLLDSDTLAANIKGVQSVLSRFIKFNDGDKATRAKLVNNFDWMKDFSLIDFSREIGKHITVNYMMSKDSVKKRISGDEGEGMSFTEFTYQLIQGYDFLHLYENEKCMLQIGGSDQWGNITTGTELIRRKVQGKAYALTSPLITKADGTKFGKTEQGNVWLDKEKTSVYKFYQFWINATDVDAENFIKVFTFIERDTVEELIAVHRDDPGRKLLQKRLAEEVTVLVHGREDYENALQASQILFGKGTAAELNKHSSQLLAEVFEGVPQADVSRSDIEKGIEIVSFATDSTSFLPSNSEARRAIKENSLSINKEKVDDSKVITTADIIADTYILLQRGKRKYFLINVV